MGFTGSTRGFTTSTLSGISGSRVGVFVDSSTLEERRDLPQRTQYFLVGRFAFPQLAHVLTALQPLFCTSVTICNRCSKGFPMACIQKRGSTCPIARCYTLICALQTCLLLCHLDRWLYGNRNRRFVCSPHLPSLKLILYSLQYIRFCQKVNSCTR